VDPAVPDAPGNPVQNEFVVPCADLDATIAYLTGSLGFRLDMIMPADSPRVAVTSGHGISLRLEAPRPAAQDTTTALGSPGLLVCRGNEGASAVGRAGMHYRDLIPGRMGGRFIASHIRIPEGGPVPDYVHYHRVRFQVIYCRRGWVRVVYEDQGPDFVMQAGDCVLQPPTIRHRVLEASPGLEVIEIGGPAEHETWREHGFDLPTTTLRPERDFGGQRFVRHVAAEAPWHDEGQPGLRFQDHGMSTATGGLVRLRILAASGDGLSATGRQVHSGEFLFLYALEGGFRLLSDALGPASFAADDACVVPSGADYALELRTGARLLELALPAPAPAN
jgi:quercetin dioxygenase-like cupin family protein